MKTGSGCIVVLLSVTMLTSLSVSLSLCIILSYFDVSRQFVSLLSPGELSPMFPSHLNTPTHVRIHVNSFTCVLMNTFHFTECIHILNLKQMLNHTNLHCLLEVKIDFIWGFLWPKGCNSAIQLQCMATVGLS